jgi:hypothetical protein
MMLLIILRLKSFKPFKTYVSLKRKGFKQYGYLKNFSLAFVPLLIKDKEFKTFSKAHIA